MREPMRGVVPHNGTPDSLHQRLILHHEPDDLPLDSGMFMPFAVREREQITIRR